MSRGRTAIGLDVQNLPLGPKAVKSRGVARCFPCRQDVPKLSQAVHRIRELTLPNLGRDKIGKGQPKISLQAAHIIVSPARNR